MSVDNCTFKKDATAITMTGGTDIVYTETGVSVPGGINVANAAQVDFRIRENISFKSRNPVKAVDGSWSKAKRTITALFPKIVASGDTVYNLVRIELEAHPEVTAAELANMKFQGAQLLGSTEVANFLATGSLRS